MFSDGSGEQQSFELPLPISVFAAVPIQKPNETFNQCTSLQVLFSGTLSHSENQGEIL